MRVELSERDLTDDHLRLTRVITAAATTVVVAAAAGLCCLRSHHDGRVELEELEQELAAEHPRQQETRVVGDQIQLEDALVVVHAERANRRALGAD